MLYGTMVKFYHLIIVTANELPFGMLHWGEILEISEYRKLSSFSHNSAGQNVNLKLSRICNSRLTWKLIITEINEPLPGLKPGVSGPLT